MIPMALRRFGRYLRPYSTWVALTGGAALVSLAASVSIPQVLKAIIDGPVAHHDAAGMAGFTVLLLLLAALEWTGQFVRRAGSGIASFSMERDMRNDFYAHLQSLQIAFHDNWQSGQLLSRAVADINTVRRFVGFGLVFAAYFVATFLTVMVMLFRLDVVLAAMTGLVAIPVFFISRWFFRRYGVIARRVQDQTGDLTTVVEEAATGVRIIKAFGRMELMEERFGAQAEGLRETNLLGVRARALTWTLVTLVPNLNLCLVLLIGGFAVLGHRLSLGGLVAFITYLFMLSWPLDALGWILAMGEEAETATARLVEVWDSEPEIADRPDAARLGASRGEIRFEGVGFSYPAATQRILSGLDLWVRPGETMALVGRTGAGKTTLASLVPRLHDASEGRVTIDGIDVRDLTLGSLRAQVGVAFEDPILFSASVRENLVMGRPDVSDEEIAGALRVAQAEFALELPWGLDTRVGEQGYTLSGGQRQRLALARAVLGRPAVLVLDDPLSSVDVHTEAVIEKALRGVLEGRTALLIVHRPSTLALADRVALLDAGRVVAVGTHSELMRGNELYRALLSQAAERKEIA